ncbi:MAG: hypothetical protein ACE5JF_08395 [Anaerolineales bacterium]
MAAAIVFVVSLFFLSEGGFDWRNDIAPAARAWWPEPWVFGFPQAPWAAAIVFPIANLPDRLATAFTNGICMLVLAAVARKYRGPEWSAILVYLSPPGFSFFVNGQTEWLVLLGLTFYNGLDPILLLIKPQVAAGVLLPRLIRAGDSWKTYIVPGAIFVVLSLVVWPLWPVRLWQSFSPVLIGSEWNASAWPWGIAVGVVLLWIAYRTRDDFWGVVASPFLFPYVNWPSYLGLLIVVAARWPRMFAIGWVLMWVLGAAFFYLV